MNYEIVNINRNEFHVIETKTNQIVTKCSKICDARKYLKHLNSGGGFDGNTPNFFLKNTKNIDFII